MIAQPTAVLSEERIYDVYQTVAHCDACGATVQVGHAASCTPWRGAWLCQDCWQALPIEEIDRVVQEVALRGVPFS